MTETITRTHIVQECRDVADSLLELATHFDYFLANPDRAQSLLSMSALVNLYADQLEVQ